MTNPLCDRIRGGLAALSLGLGLAVALAAGTAGPRAALAEDAGALAGALAAAARRDWPEAEARAAQSGPIARDLVRWQRLRAGDGMFEDYLAFARAHPDWPGMALLYRRAEAALRPGLPAADVIEWFQGGARLPETRAGAEALLAAQSASDPAAAIATLGRFWTTRPLARADALALAEAHPEALAGLHDARLANLLDRGEWRGAEDILALASPGAQAMARARIALQAGRPGVDRLILALPAEAQQDSGLALDRFRWRRRAGLDDLAQALMLERSTGAEALRDPAAWAGARADYARRALRAGDPALAERLAAGHFLPPSGADFADLEWLAGYGALRQGAADRALAHFRALAQGSGSPITLARAHYWQGRAHEAAGNAAAARGQYLLAAAWPTAYYGQLAAERLRLPMPPGLAVPGRGAETLPDWRGSALRLDPVWQAGVWLIAAGQPDQGARFLLHLSETAAPEDIGRMARLMLELNRPWDALRLAKAGAARGAVWPAAYFPLTGLEARPLGLPPELVMAIARRESEFNHAVVSPSGAQGLMQVMPETARAMARRLAEPFEQARLTRDPAYNARLGAAYLAGLRDRFGTSVALVAAGYNAGPGRAERWLGQFGDLRRNADPVDWVEMIPLDETRNYVMRVAEALPIYRARILGRPVPIVPSFDLTGGGLLPPPPQPPIRLARSARPPMSARALAWMGAGGALAEVLRGPAQVGGPGATAATGAPDPQVADIRAAILAATRPAAGVVTATFAQAGGGALAPSPGPGPAPQPAGPAGATATR